MKFYPFLWHRLVPFLMPLSHQTLSQQALSQQSLSQTDQHELPVVWASMVFKNQTLQLQFKMQAIYGHNAHHQLPMQNQPLCRQDYLWEHTCFEAFIGFANGDYLEVNISALGQWNVYAFDDYRQPSTMPPRRSNALICKQVLTQGDVTLTLSPTFLLQAAFAVDFLKDDLLRDNCDVVASLCSENITQVNLCCILKQKTIEHEQTQFYALRHAQRPDYHQRLLWANYK